MVNIRLLWVLVSVCTVACATSHRRDFPDLQPTDREVAQLMGLAEDFESALEAREFEEAEAILEELEDGVKNVDRKVIMHRDYPRISERTSRGRRRLDTKRFSHGVSSASEALSDARKRVEDRLAELERDGPTEQALDAFDDDLEQIDSRLEEGARWEKSTQYKSLAESARKEMPRWSLNLGRYRWLLAANQRLAQVLGPVVFEGGADDQLTPQMRIERAEVALRAFTGCLEAVEDLTDDEGRSWELAISTPVGSFPLKPLRAHCEQERAAIDAAASSLRWRAGIDAVQADVSGAYEATVGAKDPQPALQANVRAVDVVASCAERLGGTEELPGFDAFARFQTPWGELEAIRFREACEAAGGELLAVQPTLRWRIAVAQLNRELDAARESVKATIKLAVHEQVEGLAEAVAIFRGCGARTGELMAEPAGELAGAVADRKELDRLKRTARTCGKEVAGVGKLLTKAEKARKAKASQQMAPASKSRKKKRGKKKSKKR